MDFGLFIGNMPVKIDIDNDIVDTIRQFNHKQRTDFKGKLVSCIKGIVIEGKEQHLY